ncbi:RNA polymerase sigma-70 factor [Pedobacter frigidisoli]|uniref:RNA polymerase sigma-70 factor n=1 Tax=Pedobacter frigidisoli TaxID=2530455 RepID=UPI00292E6EB5|nr:RNA polymerase sigma-70 factor [Pedobacter frigidisoli]
MSANIPYNDQQLVLLLKQDSKEAFGEIYGRYQALLFLFAVKKLQDEEASKDIVQEVFISLWNNRATLIESAPLAPYLYRSVLNKVLNIFRGKGVTDEYINSLQHSLNRQSNLSADHLIREKDISAMIEMEISNLPDKMREVFELRRKMYLSNKEIALKLNLSEHTVATQMKNALKILRKRLGAAIFSVYFINL